MKTLSQFFVEWLGKENNNGSVKGQCVNLIKSYYQEVLGLTPFVGNANYYLSETRLSKADKPMPGDIVIFNYGAEGHIGICVWSRSADFECMEQNNPLKSPCHYVYHTDFNKILGILRPILPENSAARPGPVVNHFMMNYTCFNANPATMEQARRLLSNYSGGHLDATFIYNGQSGLTSLTQDEQISFVRNITTPFVFAFYGQDTSGYSQMQTATVIGSPIVLTAATANNHDPIQICYEMYLALYTHFGKFVEDPSDNRNTFATPDFLKRKFQEILPYVHN